MRFGVDLLERSNRCGLLHAPRSKWRLLDGHRLFASNGDGAKRQRKCYLKFRPIVVAAWKRDEHSACRDVVRPGAHAQRTAFLFRANVNGKSKRGAIVASPVAAAGAWPQVRVRLRCAFAAHAKHA